MLTLVLLSATLVTNVQTAVTGRTNVQNAVTGVVSPAAILTHVETVQRVKVLGTKARLHKPVPLETNLVNVSQRRWSELVPDATVTPPPARPAQAVKPPVAHPPPQANTNSPAFKRRQELEARRLGKQTNAPALKP